MTRRAITTSIALQRVQRAGAHRSGSRREGVDGVAGTGGMTGLLQFSFWVFTSVLIMSLLSIARGPEALARVLPDREAPELVRRVRVAPPRTAGYRVELGFSGDGREIMAAADSIWTDQWQVLRFDGETGAYIGTSEGENPLSRGIVESGWCGTRQHTVRTRSGADLMLPWVARYARERAEGTIAMVVQGCEADGGSWTTREGTGNWDGIRVGDAHVVVWNPSTEQTISDRAFTPKVVSLVIGDRSGRLILVATGGGGEVVRIRVDAQTIEHLEIEGYVETMTVSEDATTALVLHGDDRVTAFFGDRRLETRLNDAKALALSADGRVALAGGGEELLVWDLGTGEERRVALPQPVLALAASADGRRFAAVTGDWRVAVGSLADPQLPEAVDGFDATLALDGEGGVLVRAADQELFVTPDGELEIPPEDLSFPPGPSPDHLNVTLHGRTVRIEDLRQPDSAPLELNRVPSENLVHPAGEHVVIDTGSWGPMVWTSATGERKLLGMDSFATSRVVVAGRWWASASEGVIELGDVATGLRWGAFRAHSHSIVAMAAQGNSLVTLGLEGTLAMWRLPEPGPVPPRAGWLPTGAIGRVSHPGTYCGYSPPVPWEDGVSLGAVQPPACDWLHDPRADSDREVADVFQCKKGLGSQYPLDEHRTLCRAYPHVIDTVEPREPGDEDIVLVGADEVLRRFEAPTGGVQDVLVAPDGGLFLARSRAAGRLWAWDPERSEPRWERLLPKNMRTWVFSPDGSRVALAFSGGLVQVVDRDGALLSEFEHGDLAPELLWSPDGARLLLSSRGTIVSWTPASEAEKLWPPEDWGEVGGRFQASGWTPDGNRLAIIDDEGQVLFIDAEGRFEWETRGHVLPLIHMGFTPQGTLLTASREAWHEWSLQGEHLDGATPGGIEAVAVDGASLVSRVGGRWVVKDRVSGEELWSVETSEPNASVLLSNDGQSLVIRPAGGQHALLPRGDGGLRFEEGLRIVGLMPAGDAVIARKGDDFSHVRLGGKVDQMRLHDVDDLVVSDNGVWMRSGWRLHHWVPEASTEDTHTSALCRNARTLEAHAAWLTCTSNRELDLLDDHGRYRLGMTLVDGLEGPPAVSGDGRYLATMHNNGDITIWDLGLLLGSLGE